MIGSMNLNANWMRFEVDTAPACFGTQLNRLLILWSASINMFESTTKRPYHHPLSAQQEPNECEILGLHLLKMVNIREKCSSVIGGFRAICKVKIRFPYPFVCVMSNNFHRSLQLPRPIHTLCYTFQFNWIQIQYITRVFLPNEMTNTNGSDW